MKKKDGPSLLTRGTARLILTYQLAVSNSPPAQLTQLRPPLRSMPDHRIETTARRAPTNDRPRSSTRAREPAIIAKSALRGAAPNEGRVDVLRDASKPMGRRSEIARGFNRSTTRTSIGRAQKTRPYGDLANHQQHVRSRSVATGAARTRCRGRFGTIVRRGFFSSRCD